MRIVFFGSPTDAVHSLKSLISAGHDVAAVYSRPDKRSGRGRTTTPTPVAAFALEHGIPVLTPASLRGNKEEESHLASLDADAFVVVAYGRILPADILRIPRLGVINIHPSLLPLYRGPSPVVTAILDGCDETGVTVMLLDEGMDTGPILAQSDPVQLTGQERGVELQARLFEEGAAMLGGVLDRLDSGSLKPKPQDHSKAVVTRLIQRSDGEIDWSVSTTQIERMIRAYDPWPGTFTSWKGKGLKILEAVIGDESYLQAGKVAVREGRLLVGTGSGALEIRRIQLEGRQAVTAAEFLRGQPGFEAAMLGS